jgi:predicted GH43/DUF377 family glycosyl hydrolase
MIPLCWNKKGLIFETVKYSHVAWLNSFAQAPHVIKFDDFIRVYFSCRPKPNEKGQYVSHSAFVDMDFNFNVLRLADKPILDLGSRGCFDEFGIYPVSVIKINDRFHAYYAGWTRCDSVPFNTAIGLAFSTDGEYFERAGKGPILGYSLNEPFVISGPKIRYYGNKYYLFYIAGAEWIYDGDKPEPVYKIRMAISDDGIKFTKCNFNLIEDKIGIHEAQASPDVFYSNNRYHMFFCYRGGKNYRGKENGYRIGYASSADLIHWERNDHRAGLTISNKGWDSEMISYPHVFELNGQIHMMYLGNQVGREGFGLATLTHSL